MQKAARKLEPIKRMQRLFDEWTRLHAKRPRILYHYTDANGLLGMLKTQRLWATNSRFMNDPTEIEYAGRLVREIVKDEEPNHPLPLFGDVSSAIEGILYAYENENEEYLSCFCENGDLLSQWRGYGAVGGGYALGFSAKYLGLNYYQNLERPEPILRKVLYNQKQQRQLIKKWVKGLFEWETLQRRNPDRKKDAIEFNEPGWWNFNWFISECLRCFKDPAYEEEQEWRVIQYGRTVGGERPFKSEFRASRGRILQFVELDFTNSKSKYKGKLPVNVIRYGPTLDPKVTERSLRLLCAEKGYSELIAIKRSGVPFSG